MKEKRDRYVSGYAESYEAERINTEQWKKEQDIVERFLKEINPKTVLDIPVGTGRFFGKHKTTGIDVSLDMLELAEKKAKKKDDLLLGDIFELKYEDEFDVVVSMRFLNWLTTEELAVVIPKLVSASKKHLILGIHLDKGQKGDVTFHKKEAVEKIFNDNGIKVLDKDLAREDDYFIFLLEKKPAFTVSYNIMAHPKRKEYVKELEKQLPGIRVIWDTQNNIWHTRKKCLRDHIKQGCDFGITIQDDSLLCENFKQRAESFINQIGNTEGIYNFFYSKRINRDLIDKAIKEGKNYVELKMILQEICFAFPTHLMREIIKTCDDPKKKHIKPIDLAEADWVMDFRYMCDKKLSVYFSLPSLIDHKCAASSLYYGKMFVEKRAEERTAWWFDLGKWEVKEEKKAYRFVVQKKGLPRKEDSIKSLT
jgi:SAM-dependent methyltransferase